MKKISFMILFLSGMAMFFLNCFFFFNWYRLADSRFAHSRLMYLLAAVNLLTIFGSGIFLSVATVIRPRIVYVPLSIVLCVNAAFVSFQGGIGLGSGDSCWYGWPMDWLQVSTTRTWFNEQINSTRHVSIDWCKFMLSWLIFLGISLVFCWPQIIQGLRERKNFREPRRNPN